MVFFTIGILLPDNQEEYCLHSPVIIVLVFWVFALIEADSYLLGQGAISLVADGVAISKWGYIIITSNKT